MDDNGTIRIISDIPRVDIEKALTVAVRSEMGSSFDDIHRAIQEKEREFRQDIEALRDRAEAAKRSVDDILEAAKDKERMGLKEIDSLYKDSVSMRKDVDLQLDKLKEQGNQKVNRYVIPVGLVALLGILLGAWAAFGNAGSKLKDEVKASSVEVDKLKTEVAEKRGELRGLTSDLKSLADTLQQAKKDTNSTAVNGELVQLRTEMKTVLVELGRVKAMIKQQGDMPLPQQKKL